VNADTSVRIALALPLDSRPRLLAAVQIVIHFIRTYGRVELDLLERPTSLRTPTGAPRPPGTLFLSRVVHLPMDTLETRAQLESLVRAHVERRYARQGVTQVSYDLELI